MYYPKKYKEDLIEMKKALNTLINFENVVLNGK